MNILILGSGGREHALGWKIKQSPLTKSLFFAPGNVGTASLGANLNIHYNDFDLIKKSVIQEKIDMVIVGPEEPLVLGIVDFFKNDAELCNVKIIGPSKNGAQLEGSKDFAKMFMQRHNIPTARYFSVSAENIVEGKKFMSQLQPPFVLKADGLAAGKGVLIIEDYHEACKELENMLKGKFGKAGNIVLIEEFLQGIELSVFVLTDGENYVILPEAKDYKRIGEGDTGPNTGGMGSVSPVPFADENFMKKVEERIIKPTINGINKEKINYKGFIFFGLMNVKGNPYVIEYNARMGDPETQVVMPRLNNDLVKLLLALFDDSLKASVIEQDDRTAVAVVLVSGGYPGDYKKNVEIYFLENMEGYMLSDFLKNFLRFQLIENRLLFHSGTKLLDGKIVTNGGRVFAITSFGHDIFYAREKSLEFARIIKFEGKYFRSDIGFDLFSNDDTD